MSQPIILVADPTHEVLEKQLVQKGCQVLYQPELTRDGIKKQLGQCTGLVIRSKTTVDQDLLADAKHLRFVARAGAGVDLIDTDYLASRKIKLLNAPEGNRDALAEHAMGMLLAMLNRMVQANAEVKSFQWNREANRGVELRAKTVALVGYGYMGQAFAERLKAFGCSLLVYDKFKKVKSTSKLRPATWDEIFQQADILSFHVPLTKETRDWANKSFFEQFKKPIYFLNTARGEIVNTLDLLEALQKGQVRAAALDVLEEERLAQLSPEAKATYKQLFALDRVICSPHVGGWTFESYQKISEVLVQKITELLRLKK